MDYEAIAAGIKLIKRANDAITRRKYTDKPGSEWHTRKGAPEFEGGPSYNGIHGKATLSYTDDGTAYEVNVYDYQGAAMHRVTRKTLDAAFRVGKQLANERPQETAKPAEEQQQESTEAPVSACINAECGKTATVEGLYYGTWSPVCGFHSYAIQTRPLAEAQPAPQGVDVFIANLGRVQAHVEAQQQPAAVEAQRVATVEDVVKRLTDTGYEWTSVHDAMGWGMGAAQLGIGDAVTAAEALGLVRTTLLRGKLMAQIVPQDATSAPQSAQEATGEARECEECGAAPGEPCSPLFTCGAQVAQDAEDVREQQEERAVVGVPVGFAHVGAFIAGRDA